MENENRHKRKLSELSLIDDYLFGLFVQESKNEEMLKELIERMLDIKLSKVRLKQKQHEISNEPDLHGIRLDAFVQDDLNTLYDIEVQTVNQNNIPKRMRYYQSLIDREQMPSGEYDYNKLPKTIIIFVTDFDLFEKGLYRYTFKYICIENNAVSLGDESVKVILNAKGTDRTGVKPELIELLEYFHNSTEETASKSSSDFIKKLDKMLMPIKNSPKFGGDYMSYQEAMYTERKIGWQEGRKEGIREGEQKGRQEGRQEGKAEERIKLEKRLREKGMSETEIKAILAD